MVGPGRGPPTLPLQVLRIHGALTCSGGHLLIAVLTGISFSPPKLTKERLENPEKTGYIHMCRKFNEYINKFYLRNDGSFGKLYLGGREVQHFFGEGISDS